MPFKGLFQPGLYNSEEEGPIRVLIAEDDPIICRLWIQLFSGSYHIQTASTLSQALQLVADNAFEVLIVDMRLNGGTVMADSLIDAWVRLPGSNPLCVVSGGEDVDAAHSLFIRGAFNVFPKPFDPGVMRELMFKYEKHVQFQRDRIGFRKQIEMMSIAYQRLVRFSGLLMLGVVLALVGVDEPIREGLSQAFTALVGLLF